MKKVANIRFKEFSSALAFESFGELAKRSKAKYDPSSDKQNLPCIELENLSQQTGILLGTFSSKDQKSIKNRFEKGEVLFGKLRPYLKKFLIAPFDGVCSSEIWVLKGKKVSNEYLYWLIQTPKFSYDINLTIGSKMPRAEWDYISTIPFHYPIEPKEQQKITSFLSSIDSKIQQLTKKKELLERYKKGVMQKLFKQETRFKDEGGKSFPKWENKKLNQYLYEAKTRNFDMSFDKEAVLSVSGELGIVNQIEHLGRSYAGESVANYHVVQTGDIVYTKSPLKASPYGIIKVNNGKPGIVSTLYAVYRCKPNINGKFLDYYFQIDTNTNNYLKPLVHKGAKNDMKVNNAHVLTNVVKMPSLAEQEKIVVFFEGLDAKIKQVTIQLDKTKDFKKGLLQQMFV